MKRLTVLLFLGALWHVGTAWLASGLDLVPFLGVVAAASAVATWAMTRLVTEAELETEVWSVFGVSITRDVVFSLVTLLVSSMGFYWVVWPRYGWDGYVAAVAVSYGVSYVSPILLNYD